MADGVWKRIQPQVIDHFEPLLLNKFFDPSTPSIRKGRYGEKRKEKKEENNGGNSGHYVVASRPPNGDRLQRRRSCQFVSLCLT